MKIMQYTEKGRRQHQARKAYDAFFEQATFAASLVFAVLLFSAAKLIELLGL